MTQNIDTAPADATASDPGVPTAGPADPGSFSLVPPASPAAPRFALRRSRTDRMLGGVLGGLAESLGADAALLRVLAVALTLITGGAAALVYLAAWILAPEEERPAV
jgi:phage shock protein PspC (stress-responsive transcriptional regulator)